MEHLPVVVVYGGAIWKVFLALAAVAGPLGLLAAVARVRRGDRARARRRTGAPIGSLEGADDGAVVTIAGRLEGDGRIERFEDGAPGAAASVDLGRDRADDIEPTGAARADQLEIDTGAGRVSLDGAVSIVAGSRGRLSPGDFMSLAGPIRSRIATQCEAGAFFGIATRRVILRSLTFGDAVRARGVLRRVAASKGRGYRQGAAAWRLEPAGEEGRIELAAESPGFGALPLRFARRALKRAAALAAATLALMWLGGGLLLKVADEGSAEPAPVKLSSFQTLSLAAAAPFHRDEALDEITWRLRRATNPTPELGAMHGALGLLRGQCGSAVGALLEYRRYEEAARTARGCGDPGALLEAASGMFRLGLFERASELFERGHAAARETGGIGGYDLELGVAIQVGAGRWSLAAELARAQSRDQASRSRETQDEDVRALLEEGARSWECAAGELERLAAAPEALPRPGALPEGCAELAEALGRTARPAVPDDSVLLPHGLRTPTSLRLPLWSLADADKETASRESAALAAVVSAISGDDEAAGAWIRAAASRAEESWQGDVRALEAVIAVRRGDHQRATEIWRDEEWLLHDLQVVRALAAAPVGKPVAITRKSHALSQEAIEKALAGDVEPLAAELSRSGLGHFPGYLPYVARAAERGRDELLAWVRWGRYDVCYKYCRWSALLPAQAMMRDVARALGDEERERFWQQAVERTLALARDRRRAWMVLALEAL